MLFPAAAAAAASERWRTILAALRRSSLQISQKYEYVQQFGFQA